SDDGDHHQQLDQREAAPVPAGDGQAKAGHGTNPPAQAACSHWPWFLVSPPSGSATGGAFQILTVPSALAEAMCWPSGVHATLSTQPVWPRSVWSRGVPASIRPSLRSQTLTVESVLPQTTRRLSGLKATLCMPPGSRYSWNSFQSVVSQTRTT